jgi:pimeloyl-ACP methyl ester carboxylesterase
MNKSKTIVFIHGLFMNPKSWENWIGYFEAKGYKCYAPAYPYHDGKPNDLRNDISNELTKLSISDVVKSYEEFIDTLPQKPILIGHSVGGFITQKLIELNKGVLGICIDSAPPNGIFTFKWSFWRANLPVINPFKGNSPFKPSVNWFHDAFCNTMTIAETIAIYNEYVVPESRNIPRSMLNDPYGKINFNLPHHPLLFISGEKDNIIPTSLNVSNLKAYNDRNSVRDFKTFPNRTHYICGQKGWEEVAEFVQDWIMGRK